MRIDFSHDNPNPGRKAGIFSCRPWERRRPRRPQRIFQAAGYHPPPKKLAAYIAHIEANDCLLLRLAGGMPNAAYFLLQTLPIRPRSGQDDRSRAFQQPFAGGR